MNKDSSNDACLWSEESDVSVEPLLIDEEAELLKVEKDELGNVVSPFDLTKKSKRPHPIVKRMTPLQNEMRVLGGNKTRIVCMYHLHGAVCPHNHCRFSHEKDFSKLTICRFGENCRDVIEKESSENGSVFQNRAGALCVFRHSDESIDSMRNRIKLK
jgi:hypothetical protein